MINTVMTIAAPTVLSGKTNSSVALIQAQHRVALCAYCSAHALNLCVIAASKSNMVTAWGQNWRSWQCISISHQSKTTSCRNSSRASYDDRNATKANKLVALCCTQRIACHSALTMSGSTYEDIVRLRRLAMVPDLNGMLSPPRQQHIWRLS